MSGSYFALNSKINNLQAEINAIIIPSPPLPPTADIVTTNTAQTISAVKTFSVLPQSSVVPVVGDDFVNKTYADATADNTTLSQVLTAGNSATSQDITNGGTFTATSFVGALTGNASSATTSTNIAGGLGGSVPYQSAVNTTDLLANGTAGQVLQSNGTTLAPSWLTLPVAATPTLSAVMTAGNSASTTLNMNTNAISNITTATATTFVGALTGNASSATNATNATNATTSTNIAGGLGGSIPYQSAVNTTALLANGTAGQVLTSQGTTLAPTWGNVPVRFIGTNFTTITALYTPLTAPSRYTSMLSLIVPIVAANLYRITASINFQAGGASTLTDSAMAVGTAVGAGLDPPFTSFATIFALTYRSSITPVTANTMYAQNGFVLLTGTQLGGTGTQTLYLNLIFNAACGINGTPDNAATYTPSFNIELIG